MSLVYTKAPQIMRAFDEGAVIRSRHGASSRSQRERAQEGDRRQADQPEQLRSTVPAGLRLVARWKAPLLIMEAVASGDEACKASGRGAIPDRLVWTLDTVRP